MARKRYTPEQIIAMLREAEVRLSQGEKIGAISRSLGISEQSCYRWRMPTRSYQLLLAACPINVLAWSWWPNPRCASVSPSGRSRSPEL
ncbi:transposase [Caenibius tardaugens]|uniref:transposase n=1 Tax=Caenibius tardaugens TaxID=169176 RepID=UPI000A0562B8|nr:hypothetical protein EGO55_19915 [Caenibius tardaugens NBRC 16725]